MRCRALSEKISAPECTTNQQTEDLPKHQLEHRRRGYATTRHHDDSNVTNAAEEAVSNDTIDAPEEGNILSGGHEMNLLRSSEQDPVPVLPRQSRRRGGDSSYSTGSSDDNDEYNMIPTHNMIRSGGASSVNVPVSQQACSSSQFRDVDSDTSTGDMTVSDCTPDTKSGSGQAHIPGRTCLGRSATLARHVT
ncbi:hypothetical protein LSAT2_029946 [Lamellibrachia satsuma]|nr:hypothetical protein LSAT2_029946 [Lamellibrachia satsuma]